MRIFTVKVEILATCKVISPTHTEFEITVSPTSRFLVMFQRPRNLFANCDVGKCGKVPQTRKALSRTHISAKAANVAKLLQLLNKRRITPYTPTRSVAMPPPTEP